ncbi:MAG TPA: radical SAM/SPASM domain-containing protein, partial [Candidatus Cloacimonas sp.]|nr:radical SAM/SPASM domain-containing protein [Candidatus Cloacimonas sp.]
MNTDNFTLTKAFLVKERLRQTCGIVCNYGLSLVLRKPLVHYYPPILMLEPTNICNLHCPLCLTGNGKLLRPKGMMSLPLFQKICREVQDKIGMLILWNQGEPFLNPDFYAMLEFAAKQKFYAMTSTNASLELDNERIVRSGLQKIIISLDGITAETYNKYRINGNFELVLKNMQDLVRLKEKWQSSKPYIVWQFLIMKHNENEIEEVQKMAKGLKIDKLEFKTAQIYSSEDLAFLPAKHIYSRYLQRGDNFMLKTELKNRCRRLWMQPVINWDG